MHSALVAVCQPLLSDKLFHSVLAEVFQSIVVLCWCKFGWQMGLCFPCWIFSTLFFLAHNGEVYGHEKLKLKRASRHCWDNLPVEVCLHNGDLTFQSAQGTFQALGEKTGHPAWECHPFHKMSLVNEQGQRTTNPTCCSMCGAKAFTSSVGWMGNTYKPSLSQMTQRSVTSWNRFTKMEQV